MGDEYVSNRISKFEGIALNQLVFSGNCVTDNAGKECVFPFTHKGTIYHGCTSNGHPNNQYWCATSQMYIPNPIYGRGDWGHCSPMCPVDQTPEKSKQLLDIFYKTIPYSLKCL